MIYDIKQYPDKKFTDKMDMTRFIKANIEQMKQIKLSEYKTLSQSNIGDDIYKGFVPTIESITSDFIEVKAVINTTNIIDNHRDLHMPEIWNKTVKDNPYSYHLKQHESQFESVISNKAKSFNEKTNFKNLGLTVDFNTVANINQFVISKSKVPYMFERYKDGDVLEHSVGMIYVNLSIAYYDEDDQKEMDYFNEMKKHAVNSDLADELGYFWVVSEAKKREGSAVVFGSNSVTPTLWVKNYDPTKKENKFEPSEDTQKTIEPLQSTQKGFLEKLGSKL